MNTLTTAHDWAWRGSAVNIAELVMVEFLAPNRWWSMLATARTFRRHSPINQLWLAAQHATGVVASSRTWQQTPAVGGGRCRVAGNARGLSVLTPTSFTTPTRSFQVMTVFEDSQLVAPPDLPALATPRMITGPNAYEHVWTAIVTLLRDDGWTVEIRPRNEEAWNRRTSRHDRTVAINDDVTLVERLAVLLHEWAHIALVHHGSGVTDDVRDIEARSVGYLVGATLGLRIEVVALDVGAILELEGAGVAEAAERVLTVSQHLTTDIENELGIDLTHDLFGVCAASAAPQRHPPIPERHHLVAVSVRSGHARPSLRCVSNTEICQ